jgi:hypothetical protein
VLSSLFARASAKGLIEGASKKLDVWRYGLWIWGVLKAYTNLRNRSGAGEIDVLAENECRDSDLLNFACWSEMRIDNHKRDQYGTVGVIGVVIEAEGDSEEVQCGSEIEYRDE